MNYFLHCLGKSDRHVNEEVGPYIISLPLVNPKKKDYYLSGHYYNWKITEDGKFKVEYLFWDQRICASFVYVKIINVNGSPWIEFEENLWGEEDSVYTKVSINCLMIEVEKTYKSSSLEPFIKWLDIQRKLDATSD